MRFGFIPNKESLRLFLRSYIIRSHLERELCIKKDIKPEKKRLSYKSTGLLILLLSVFYYLCTVFPRIEMIKESIGKNNYREVTGANFKDNHTEVPVTFRSRQIAKPPSIFTYINETEKKRWAAYWYYQDKLLHLFKLKIQTLENEQKNLYTPHSEDPVATPPPSYLTSTILEPNLKTCEMKHNVTGNVSLHLTKVNEDLERIYPMVQKGGYYKPPNCWSIHKVAILVPYRYRPENLELFLYNIHPFLMAQNLEYRIFVIEQSGHYIFNKGRLFNAGYKEMKKWGQWRCVIFHDVDLLPLSRKITYNCPSLPRIMSTSILQMKLSGSAFELKPRFICPGGICSDKKPWRRFGGVAAMTLKHYEKVNGHSNIYWGLGLEGIDMFMRLRYSLIPIIRYSANVSQYIELPHSRITENIKWFLLNNAGERSKYDGLSTVNYKLKRVALHHLYTHIVVDLDTQARERPSHETLITSLKYPPEEKLVPTIPGDFVI